MATNPDDSRVHLVVSVQGIDLGAQVSYVDVEDHDRLIDRATVVLDDPFGAVGDIPREGQALQVELGWVSEYAVLFDGDITRVVTEARGSLERRVTLVALDISYRLMQGAPKTRDHTGSLSSIMKAIVAEYSLPVGQVQLDPDPSFTDDLPLRQTNQKDWAFIQDLAHRYRARAFVEYNDGQSQFYAISEPQLVQGDSQGSLTYQEGPGQLLEFRYERIAASAMPQSSGVTIDPSTGNVVTAPPPPPVTPEAPPAPDPARSQLLDSVGSGPSNDYSQAFEQVATAQRTPDQQRPQNVYAGLPSDPAIPDRVARMDPTSVLGLHGEGLAVGTVMLRAKGKIGIQGIANWAEGDWYVRQVNHIMAENTYYTRFVVSR
jgi:phage protein D